MLGAVGFSIITVAALISTFSAINASLYGGSRVNYEIAEDDELPHHFLSKLWNHPLGLLITSIATLILVNLLDLESISIAGSIAFILIFCLVNFIAFKLSEEINGNKVIPILGFILCLIADVVLINQQFESNLVGILVSFSIIIFCFLSEWIYKRTEQK